MKKVFLLCLMLFILTGCTAQYKITINEDLTLSEEALLSGDEEFYASYYKSTKSNVLKMLINSYKSILDKNQYHYELNNENNPSVTISKDYESIPLFIESTLLFNDYFDEVKYTEKNNIKRIETIGFKDNNPEDPNRFYIKNLEIAIKCPFKVLEHNATRIDKKNNIYYYELFKDNKIILEYDTYSKFNPSDETIKIILIAFGVVVFGWLAIIILNKKNKI